MDHIFMLVGQVFDVPPEERLGGPALGTWKYEILAIDVDRSAALVSRDKHQAYSQTGRVRNLRILRCSEVIVGDQAKPSVDHSFQDD